jgi:hypothetical protein
MMFKSKEELIKENKTCSFKDEEDSAFNDGVEVGVKEAFKSFAERKEFYKKYRNYSIPAFIEENSEFQDEILNYVRKIIKVSDLSIELLYKFQDDFRDWLFDFCFDGVE